MRNHVARGVLVSPQSHLPEISALSWLALGGDPVSFGVGVSESLDARMFSPGLLSTRGPENTYVVGLTDQILTDTSKTVTDTLPARALWRSRVGFFECSLNHFLLKKPAANSQDYGCSFNLRRRAKL